MTVGGFQEGDFVLLDVELMNNYLPVVEAIEGEDVVSGVITDKIEPKTGSKSCRYRVRAFPENQDPIQGIPVLDDCFIKACQHCRSRMLYHDKELQYFCPFC